MAGEWIKMRADLFTHPKVIRISSALQADTLRTVGGLMSVWCLFDAHSEDGTLDGYTPEFLDAHLRWGGFAAAMIAVGWLEHDPENGLSLPRFDSHNGQSSKRRATDTERKREIRKVSATDADKKRTREEKRREDVVTEVTTPQTPSGLDNQAWARWVDYRKSISKPIKPASVESAQRALAKHGPDQASVVEQSIANGWQGLFDLKGKVSPATATSRIAQPQALSFAERDELARRKRWEEMTGRKWPESDQDAIDVTPTILEIEHGHSDQSN